MKKISFIIMLLVFVCYYLLDSKATQDELICILEAPLIEYSGSLKIDGPANIRTVPNGQVQASLVDGTLVNLIGIEKNWAKINNLNISGTQTDTGWTHLQNLPYPGLLEDPALFIEVEEIKDQTAAIEALGALNFKAIPSQKDLLHNLIAPNDNYSSVNHQLIYSGLADFPLLLHYSGQAGDIINEPGGLVAFHPNRSGKKVLRLKQGNRVMSQFIDICEGHISVREAFFCQLPIVSKITWTLPELTRIKGTFDPPIQLPNPDYLDDEEQHITLERDVLLYRDQSLHQDSAQLIPMGQAYQLRLLQVNYQTGIIQIQMNEYTGWLLLETCLDLDLLNGPYGAGCEAG